MIVTSTDTESAAARAAAVAVFGSILATLFGIIVSLATSTEIGGVVGCVGLALALFIAVRGLPVLSYLENLDAVPAAAITLLLMGGLVPASLHLTVLPGISIDDVPTIVGVGMAAWWLLNQRASASLPRLIVPMIGLITWAVIAWALVSPTLKVLLVGPGRWTMYTLMVVVGVAWFRDAKLRWWAIGVLMAIATGQALLSIWSYHSNWFVGGMFIGIEPFRWYQPLSEVVNGRTTGLLGIPSNFFGAYMLIPAFVSLGVAAHTKHRWLSAAMLATYGVLAYAGILSYTRATLIGLVLGLIGFLVVARPFRLVPAIIAITVIAILATPIISRFQEGNDRAALASQAGHSIIDNAFVGVGSGEYLAGESSSPDDPEQPTVTPHNSFLLQASETGLLGGAILLAAVLALLGAIWGGTMPRGTGSGVMATAIFAGLGAVLIQTMSNNLLHIPPVATQFWMIGTAGATFAMDAGGRWAQYLLAPIYERRTP